MHYKIQDGWRREGFPLVESSPVRAAPSTELPWRQAAWLCTLPQNPVELFRWSRFAMNTFSQILFWQDSFLRLQATSLLSRGKMSRENEGKLTKSIFTTSQKTIQDHTKLQCCPAYRITLKIGPRSLETDMSLSLFPSSSTSSSSSLSRRWRMPLVLGLPLPLPAILPPRLALAATRQADAAGVGVFTSVGVKKTPSCLQVKEANLLFMIDWAILVNWKKM